MPGTWSTPLSGRISSRCSIASRPAAAAISSAKTFAEKAWKMLHTERIQPTRTPGRMPANSMRWFSTVYGRLEKPISSSQSAGIVAPPSNTVVIDGNAVRSSQALGWPRSSIAAWWYCALDAWK